MAKSLGGSTSRQAQNGRDSMYVEALKASSSSRKLVRARACFCVPLPTRPLQIDTFGLATGVTRQDWGIQGFPPSWAKMWCLCLLMFMWCAFMVLCTVTKTQILLRNHRRHHRRVSNLRHNQIVMMHLSIQRQSIAGYTVTSVRPSRQRKALCHLCAFFSPVLEPCVKKHWKCV